MKHFTLKFIQVAWVVEGIAAVVFSIAAIIFLKTEQVALWQQVLPTLIGLILAQGTAAGGGPLLSDAIKAKAEKEEGEKK